MCSLYPFRLPMNLRNRCATMWRRGLLPLGDALWIGALITLLAPIRCQGQNVATVNIALPGGSGEGSDAPALCACIGVIIATTPLPIGIDIPMGSPSKKELCAWCR